MLSPALLRICCLAVMAPALTKAVKQADGVVSNGPFNFVPRDFKQLMSDDCTLVPVNGIAQEAPFDKCESINGGHNILEWRGKRDITDKRPVECNQLATNELHRENSLPKDIKKINLNGAHKSAVGVSPPTVNCGDHNNTMNEDIAVAKEKMGLLKANTSLDYFKTQLENHCTSPCSTDYKPDGFVADFSSKCVSSVPSSPGSPKSNSGDSASTLTAPNPTAVTFSELEEVHSSCQKSLLRAKCLVKRIRKTQLCQTSSHVSNQLKAVVDYYQKLLSVPCQRQVKNNIHRRSKDDLKADIFQDENVRNLSTAALVSLVRKLNNSSSDKFHLHRNLSQFSEANVSEDCLIKISSRECEEIKRVTSTYLTHISHLESAVDSDVTESSSGGESCDEFEDFDEDKSQEAVPVHKRAKWKWLIDRAAVASRWTWLYSQVSDLEYRLRQVAEKHKKVQTEKGRVCFEEPVVCDDSALTKAREGIHILKNDVQNQLPVKKVNKSVMNGCVDHASIITNNEYNTMCNISSVQEPCSDIHPHNMSTDDPVPNSVSRTRPMKMEQFRKRKLVRTTGLHLTSRKAARLSTVKCSCNYQSDVTPCVLCGGRYNNTQSVDPDTMPLLERIALLEPSFHPVLSFEQDIPLSLHFENHMKKSETYYRVTKVVSPIPKKPRMSIKSQSLLEQARQHSRKLKKYATQTLLTSARYRSNKHARASAQKHILKKLQRLQRGAFNVPEHLRDNSAASSCSSRQESPVRSPSSAVEDGNEGYGREQDPRRRRDNYGIDDIVMPYNFTSASSVFIKLPYKEIIIPNWRVAKDNSTAEKNSFEENEVEDISDEAFIKRHNRLEVEERLIVRGGGAQRMLNSVPARRSRRNGRYDSQADSSGANTPDPVPVYQNDIMFHDNNTAFSGSPCSPMSPPMTPGSLSVMSDDSQPSGSISGFKLEKRRTSTVKRDRSSDDTNRLPLQEQICHPPYEVRTFPLSDKEFEDMLKDSSHLNHPENSDEMPYKDPGTPASPDSSSSTSSALEEDDEEADPEWTVVNPQGSEQTLVLKFAKR